jgi:hypothetical protein
LWHLFVLVGRANAFEEWAFCCVAWDDGGAFRFAACQCAVSCVEVEAAFRFAALVALEAAGFEEGLDAFPEIDSLSGFCGGLGLEGRDFLGEEMVDRVVGGEAFGECRNLWSRVFCEPLVGDGATFFPVWQGLVPSARTRISVNGGEACFFCGLEEIPRGVAIDGAIGSWGGEVPRLRPVWRPGDDGFTEFRASPTFRAENVTDDGFEGEVVFATGTFKLAPSVSVSGGGETEVATEVEEVVLHFDGLVIGAWGREGSAEDVFIVDEEDRGSTCAEEDAMFAGGQVHFRECAKEEGVVSRGADAGFNILVGHAEEAERGCVVGFGCCEGVLGPEV